MFRGRPPLASGTLGWKKRRPQLGSEVNIPDLELAFSSRTGVPEKLLSESGSIAGDQVTKILLDYIVLAQEVAEKKKGGARPPPTSEPSVKKRLSTSPLFQHAVIACGVNSYKGLRSSDPSVAEVLPSHDQIWKEKTVMVSNLLMPLITVRGLGIELHPQKMMSQLRSHGVKSSRRSVG